MASFQSMRMASQAKDNEEKKVQERKKALLVLICRHLCDYGYIESAERLQTEGGISLQNVDAADNIDLLNVLQEYEDFYEIRFQRRPKLTRKLGIDARTAAEQAKLPSVSKIGASSARRRPSLTSSTKASDDDSASDAAPNGKPSSAPGVGRPPKGAGAGGAVATKKAPAEDPRMGLNITSSKAVVGEGSQAQAEAKFRKGGGGDAGTAGDKDGDPNEFWERRLLKPLPDFGGNSEMRELGAQIQRDVLSANPDVRWSDVASNGSATNPFSLIIIDTELFTRETCFVRMREYHAPGPWVNG